MSKSQQDGDGFQIVTKRSAKNKQVRLPLYIGTKLEKDNNSIDIKQTLSRINSTTADLQSSTYLKNILTSFESLQRYSKVVEIVCFGLGHFAECITSRHQLALLLSLKDYCKPERVLVHDPIFYSSECNILIELGFNLIDENKEGCYVIPEEGLTLVYLPHCPKQLTNNFLWSNWSPRLKNCILLCNSFSSLVENQPSRILSETVPYIYNLYPYTKEVLLENNFKFTDIFNDTSIHCFPKETLDNLDLGFWIADKKPQYKNTEEFITSQMIDKLNI